MIALEKDPGREGPVGAGTGEEPARRGQAGIKSPLLSGSWKVGIALETLRQMKKMRRTVMVMVGRPVDRPCRMTHLSTWPVG